jgi:hypothetical protein
MILSDVNVKVDIKFYRTISQKDNNWVMCESAAGGDGGGQSISLSRTLHVLESKTLTTYTLRDKI